MRKLIPKMQNIDNSLPFNSCYLCEKLLKECACTQFQIEDDVMDNDSQEHSFKAGDWVTVVPDLEAMHGDYIVARNNADNWTALRRYMKKDGKKYLEALNPSYPLIPFSSNIEIIGVVKAHKQLLT